MHQDESQLLDILNAHGQNFLSSFGNLQSSSSNRKRQARLSSQYQSDDEHEEWHGIEAHSPNESEDYSSSESEDTAQDDDIPTPSNQLVVFTENSSRSSHQLTSKTDMKAFMSSKVSKMLADTQRLSQGASKQENEDAEIERTNAENDALLHRLVHTQLLSGSLNPDLQLTSAQRKKAFAGRILELAGSSKLGKGEKSVRDAERNKASKRVREGLTAKQSDREKQRLDEAKNLGNYHPIVKKLYDAASPLTKKRRERGLRMGVGKFKGGMLDLSQERKMMDRAQQVGNHTGKKKRRIK